MRVEEELIKMEDALSQAEATKNNLKATIVNLGRTVDELEGAMTAVSSLDSLDPNTNESLTMKQASHILSASLVCSICFETSSNPTRSDSLPVCSNKQLLNDVYDVQFEVRSFLLSRLPAMLVSQQVRRRMRREGYQINR